jgi:hypothetical protein
VACGLLLVVVVVVVVVVLEERGMLHLKVSPRFPPGS